MFFPHCVFLLTNSTAALLFIFSRKPLSEEIKKNFSLACDGINNTLGDIVKRANICEMNRILANTEPTQLPELLKWEWLSMTPLDWALWNNDEQCALTIINHILDENILDVNMLACIFPYTSIIQSENSAIQILEVLAELRKILDWITMLQSETQFYTKQTAFDILIRQNRENLRCVIAYISNTTRAMPVLVETFPYSGAVYTVEECEEILKDKSKAESIELFQAVTNETMQTCLMTACAVGNKELVIHMLSKLQSLGIVEEQLMRHDREGRTALWLARAERARCWSHSSNKHIIEEVLESDTYTARVETAEVMMEWIQEYTPCIASQVDTW